MGCAGTLDRRNPKSHFILCRLEENGQRSFNTGKKGILHLPQETANFSIAAYAKARIAKIRRRRISVKLNCRAAPFCVFFNCLAITFWKTVRYHEYSINRQGLLAQGGRRMGSARHRYVAWLSPLPRAAAAFSASSPVRPVFCRTVLFYSAYPKFLWVLFHSTRGRCPSLARRRPFSARIGKVLDGSKTPKIIIHFKYIGHGHVALGEIGEHLARGIGNMI